MLGKLRNTQANCRGSGRGHRGQADWKSPPKARGFPPPGHRASPVSSEASLKPVLKCPPPVGQIAWHLPRLPALPRLGREGQAALEAFLALLVRPAALGPLTSPHQTESESGAKARRHHHFQKAPLFLPPAGPRVPSSAKPHCSHRLPAVGARLDPASLAP